MKHHASISRAADVCPHCSGVETLRVYRTLKFPKAKRIARYCVCKKCRNTVTLTVRYR